MYHAFKQFIGTKAETILCFIVNNKHIYPIKDKTIQKYISKAKRIDRDTIINFNYSNAKYFILTIW